LDCGCIAGISSRAFQISQLYFTFISGSGLITGNFLGNSLSQIQHRKKMQNLLCASFVVLALLGIAVMAGHKVLRHYCLPNYQCIFSQVH